MALVVQRVSAAYGGRGFEGGGEGENVRGLTFLISTYVTYTKQVYVPVVLVPRKSARARPARTEVAAWALRATRRIMTRKEQVAKRKAKTKRCR
jgi:hypothetical protein